MTSGEQPEVFFLEKKHQKYEVDYFALTALTALTLFIVSKLYEKRELTNVDKG